MDFHRLIQKAAANQKVAEKVHESKKQKKEDEEKHHRAIQLLKEKKAAKMLKERKAEAERKQLEYKGLLVRSKEGLCVTQPSTALSASSASTASRETQQNWNQQCKKDDVKTMSHHHSFTGKASTQSKKGVKQKNSGTGLSKSTHGPGSDKMNRPAKMDQPAKKQPKTPMNFQDLMKMAEKKSEEVVEKEKSKLQVKDPLIGRRSISPKLRSSSPFESSKTSRGSSPVGKSLVERTNSRLKRTHSMMERNDICISKHATEVLHTNGGGPGRQQSDRVGTGKAGEGAMASCKSASGVRTIKTPVGRVAGMKEVPGDRGRMVAGEAQYRAAKQSSMVDRTRAPSAALQQQRLKQKTNAVKPNSFYGQPASARLLQEGRFATRRGPVKYRSTWVDEMSDYVRQKVSEEEYYSSDDDDDLDDFVVSGDEELEEGEEDVSSAIRQIFGYDRRKFAAERDDDLAMESSFAQQQFEEQRSAQIGQMEDAEDMKREQMELNRKRRRMELKKSGGKANLLQSKLNFHTSR